MLDLQIVRGALKAYRSLQTSGFSAEAVARLPPSASYLRFVAAASSELIEPDWTNPNEVVNLLQRRAAVMVQNRVDERNIDASMDNRVSKAAIDAYLAVRVSTLIEDAQRMLRAREAAAVGKLYVLVRDLRRLAYREPRAQRLP